MSVEMISDKTEVYLGGVTTTFNSVDEATEQALHDLRTDRSPGPNRIEEDGKIVIDKAGLEKLARSTPAT